MENNFNDLIERSFKDFGSDNVNIFMMLVDASGSMSGDEDNVKEGLRQYKKSFENFPEKGSIAVSISNFNCDVYLKPFTSIDGIRIEYSADGSTALHYSICKAAEYLEEYMREVTERKNIIPKATFIVFSDGHPERDKASEEEGREAIERLNYQGITTVFVAFGESIEKKYGEKMKFMSVKDVRSREDITGFLGDELSRSCKEQSKSMKGLGSNFFSEACNDNSSSSAGYSTSSEQPLEDDSWINDI